MQDMYSSPPQLKINSQPRFQPKRLHLFGNIFQRFYYGDILRTFFFAGAAFRTIACEIIFLGIQRPGACYVLRKTGNHPCGVG